jgi:hypothetical protein
VFGNLQLVFVLDARQLPPVPDKLVGDQGEFCFESEVWKDVFQHRINLTGNHRSKDPELAAFVKELR